MIDNFTLVKNFKPPNELNIAAGKPFEYNGILYSPKYRHGEVQRYEGQLKNLRFYLYPDRIYLFNSLHKYWTDNNHSDFHLREMRNAIEAVNEDTGINWHNATVKKIEYGCNVEANAPRTYRSLLGYRGKDYLPMHYRGKIYGAVCEFTDHKMKGYDKAFQVQEVERTKLHLPLFRWEISIARMRSIENKLNCTAPLTVYKLMKQDTWNILANDAISKYQNSIKMQKIHLHKLSAHQKRVIAEMLVPKIREDLKIHNRDTYKRDRRIYMSIISDKTICEEDDTIEKLKAKFEELCCDRHIIERHNCKLVI